MKRVLSVLFVLVFSSFAFANGVSLNSPGTRAIGMGGAYISIADDYSAPYWNPAGLVNINGPQFSLFVTDIMPSATYKVENFPYSGASIDAKSKSMHVIAPNASFLWKCMINNKLHLGLSFIVPAGLAVEWDGADLAPLAAGNGNLDWKSSIAVYNISLSLAGQVTDNLNFGWAFHYVHGTMEMYKGTASQVAPGVFYSGQYSEESDGSGLGFGLGIQYKCCDKTTLGFAMRTDQGIKFEGTAKNTLFTQIGYPTETKFYRNITWPTWIGGGVAHHFSEKLLVALEAQWSNWEGFEQELTAVYDNATWNAVMVGTGQDKIHLKWKNQTQIRIGVEYLLSNALALRCGAYLDPAPGPDETQTILIPNTDFTTVTFGFGYKPTEKIAVDFGFEYLMGAERDIAAADVMLNPVTGAPVGMPGKHGLNIMVPSVAFTYKF